MGQAGLQGGPSAMRGTVTTMGLQRMRENIEQETNRLGRGWHGTVSAQPIDTKNAFMGRAGLQGPPSAIRGTVTTMGLQRMRENMKQES